jgi:hypothetical protein
MPTAVMPKGVEHRPESEAAMKPVAARRGQTHAFGPGFRGLVRRTMLLNLGIFLSALVMGMLWGKTSVLGLVLLLVVTSTVLWTITFAISSFVWIGQVFWKDRVLDPKPPRRRLPTARGVTDEWLDGT